MGELFLDLLGERDLPNVVDARGKGLMLAVEFDSKPRRDDVVDAAVKRGLLTLGCGTRTLRVLPPLDVTEREVTMGADLLAAAIEDAA
jgi:4-aminobutyrate aminotransferase